MNDLWQLPERYQLRNAYADLIINTDEPLFLIRAILRMAWRPMIPIHVARILFQTDIVPNMFGTLTAILPLYYQVGIYAFIPLVASSGIFILKWAANRFLGEAYEWDPKSGFYRSRDDVGNIYFSIKTVKMFGWERMYLDPKLKKHQEHLKRLPCFRWNKKASILKKVTFKVAGNDLVAVIGKTGSGKSSLLLALCRELEMVKGAGKVVGRIGYLEQSPWIMNDTMRANILFGREFDEEYYEKVIHACALTRDIESWPDGDLTLIGERGINISGGQRARLALARTVYSRADVYILDDPLSAVDAHVKRHILDNVILSSGLLGNSLRVVTTHAESMLPFCNQIVTVSDRTVSVVHQEPKEHIITTPVSASDTPTACDATSNKTDADSVSDALIADDITQTDTENATQADGPELAKEKEQPKEWTLWENAKYVFNLCGWHVFILFVVTASLRPVSDFILDGYNIAALKESAKSDSVSHDAVLWYLKVRLLKAATREILIVIENSICKMLSDDKIEGTIQEKFVHSLLYAPMSLLEKADRFKISSAFNKGSSVMAYRIPGYLCSESSNVLESVLSIWRAAQTTPQFMLIVPFAVWARTRTSKLTDAISESVSDIKAEASSKHSQTSSIIEDGSLMIRLFGVESYFMSRYISDQDEEARIKEPVGSLRCLSDLVSHGIHDAGKIISLFSVVIQSHLTKYKVSSGQMKALHGDMAGLIYNIGRLVDMPSRLQTFSKGVGTFRQFSDLEAEGPYIVEDCRVPSEWPHSGNVEFKNLSVKYGTDQDYALKNLNVAIRPGEKIGIVGRTGAGKSTLAKAIFRLLNENVEGSIEIDGHDIAKFGVGDFRPKLGIIPQESTMFSGTVRRNLDPLNEFTIEDMWAAMIKCGVADVIEPKRKRKSAGTGDDDEDYDEDEDKGEEKENLKAEKERWNKAGVLMRVALFLFKMNEDKNANDNHVRIGINRTVGQYDSRFSSGQRQLFSLCRLLMRKRKVLILDEATAEVDLETDGKMQELIRSEFGDCTVLTIAHRLDTIMNSDRIIVMEKGKIAEIGPPQELIAKGGMFAELVKANEF
ncbi:Multidrug resistance-associated protein 1 [Coemansia sp. BCRC 34962]|nr:Multidrug resistance-associated protein 1 [Coemansia sp. BCRC 34962]